MEGLFSRVPELMGLGVSESRIRAVDCSLVPLTLSWFDISHSEVPSLDSFTDLHSGLISYRDAGFSQLDKLESNSFPTAGSVLLLNNGGISEVAPNAFFHLTKLAKADLLVNSISSLTEGASQRTPWPPFLQPGWRPNCLQLPHAVVPEHQPRGKVGRLPAHH